MVQQLLTIYLASSSSTTTTPLSLTHSLCDQTLRIHTHQPVGIQYIRAHSRLSHTSTSANIFLTCTAHDLRPCRPGCALSRCSLIRKTNIRLLGHELAFISCTKLRTLRCHNLTKHCITLDSHNADVNRFLAFIHVQLLNLAQTIDGMVG